MKSLAALGLCFCAAVAQRPPGNPVSEILSAFESYRVVAIGENHGHLELHQLVLQLLENPDTPGLINDVAVEWGNALYQDVVDRFVRGEEVPWDSVTMAWRNTVVSPNTVWDSPIYENFFREVRRINSNLKPEDGYRVLLADSPVEWRSVDSVPDLQPFFDRATSMSEVIRRESLLNGRRSLFFAGGLHVAKKPRVRTNLAGVPVGEITPIAWLELRHPGSTYVIQSMGSAKRLGLPELIGEGPPTILKLDPFDGPGQLQANRISTLRNRNGTKPDVYGELVIGDIIDAVIIWDPEDVTLLEPAPEVFRIDWYWEELNRRSILLRGEPMDPSLRDPGGRNLIR